MDRPLHLRRMAAHLPGRSMYLAAALLAGTTVAQACTVAPPKQEPPTTGTSVIETDVSRSEARKAQYRIACDPAHPDIDGATIFVIDDIDGFVIDDAFRARVLATPLLLPPKQVTVPPSWLKRSVSRVSSTPARPRGLGSARKRGIVGTKKRCRKNRQ